MFIYKHLGEQEQLNNRGLVKNMDFTSSQFIEQLKCRNSEAIERVVRSYTEALYRGALGLGFDPLTSEELVQSVWVTFFDVAATFEGRSHVRTFIFGIMYNKALELRREKKKIENTDPIEEVMESRFDSTGRWSKPPVDPEQFLVASQTMELIQKCIDALPINQRMAFCLREIDDHGSSDICNILGVTVTNLGVLLYRAKNRLRECIEGKSKAKP